MIRWNWKCQLLLALLKTLWVARECDISLDAILTWRCEHDYIHHTDFTCNKTPRFCCLTCNQGSLTFNFQQQRNCIDRHFYAKRKPHSDANPLALEVICAIVHFLKNHVSSTVISVCSGHFNSNLINNTKTGYLKCDAIIYYQYQLNLNVEYNMQPIFK